MNYELMLVVNPASDSKGLIGGVEKTVKDAGAKDIKVQNLGKKQMAYSIRRNTEAEYVLINFEAEGEAIKALNDKLRLEQEALLRYLIIKSSGKVSPTVSPQVTAKVTVKAGVEKKTIETKQGKIKPVKKVVKTKTPVKKTATKKKK